MKYQNEQNKKEEMVAIISIGVISVLCAGIVKLLPIDDYVLSKSITYKTVHNSESSIIINNNSPKIKIEKKIFEPMEHVICIDDLGLDENIEGYGEPYTHHGKKYLINTETVLVDVYTDETGEYHPFPGTVVKENDKQEILEKSL